MMADWRGGAELDTMRLIKRALDPLGLMNPGKVLP
jgi:FAD/FMN-containing dehydrogenase